MADALTDLTRAVLDRRLDPKATAPIAVAYSGGGDSLAALIAAKTWADRAGRRVVGLHVDHQIQAASGAWADRAEATCGALGVAFQRLVWSGPKPARGLAAAARQARHARLADAARALGANIIVLGHTADDILEGDIMRAEGASLGRLREWRPSPVWPAGRGLFLLRPLLSIRRAALREALRDRGLAWIDDPANEDLASPRIRARQAIAGQAPAAAIAPSCQGAAALADLARACRLAKWGAIELDRARLRAAAPAVARRWLSAALVCAAGAAVPARGERLQTLLNGLLGDQPMVATLAGAQVTASETILIARETGAYRRQGAPHFDLSPGETATWDGRFELRSWADTPLAIAPLAGLQAKLEPDQRARLAMLPKQARGSLPVATRADGPPTCPVLAGALSATAKSLIAARLFGACDVISKESEI